MPKIHVQSKGSENTFEVVIGSREAYRLEPIDKIQSAGLLDYEKMARLTAMHHLGSTSLKEKGHVMSRTRAFTCSRRNGVK